MIKVLDVGCGPSSDADVQIDIVLYENMKKYVHHVMDAMMEDWPIEDETVSKVKMEMFLEHCPVSVRYQSPTTFDTIIEHPRIHCMKEAYRVLKHGGILHVSVPGSPETHSQDPTHEGPQITEGWFNYFCGQWGGNTPGDFATESYGINFAFRRTFYENDGFSLTIELVKD